jgi:uncharacterized protein YndB with AHSA1/START domain
MAQANTIQEKPHLAITRRYPVAPEKVWRAWTDPQALSRWFGPGEMDCVTVAELDVRVGGRYRIAFRTADGQDHCVSGEYQEVAAGRKLRFTWAWRGTSDRVSLVTIEIKPVAQGCEMNFRHERFFDQQACRAHEQGWVGTFAKLDRMLAS